MSEEESKEVEQSNNIGRPTVMTPKTIEKLRDAYMYGCTDEEACLYADIAPATLYYYQNDNPNFLDKKKMWKENPALKARTTVVKDLENITTAKWYLEKKAPDFNRDDQQERPTTQLQANEMHFHSDGNKNITNKFVKAVKEQNKLPDGEPVEGTTE